MSRLSALLGSAVFFLIAPGTVAAVVPLWITQGHLAPPVFDSEISRWVGGVVILIGLLPLVGSFFRFAWQGLGTPAPVAPPTHLVVAGSFAHVRNPMYVAVLVILAGDALVLGDSRILVWALLVWAAAHLFVVLYEEPALARKFGDEYRRYRAHVPRWLPRLRAWRPA